MKRLKFAEQELRQAEEVRSRLASIVENSTDAIDSKTLDGTIVTLNPSAEKLYGYSEEERADLPTMP